MEEAIELARQGMTAGKGGPFGCVIVKGEEVVGKGCNLVISTMDPTAHAEIVALREGGKLLDNYRLEDTTLYVTLEPCPMCAMAMVHARVSRVVFGAWDVKAGGAGSIVDVFTLPGLNHRVDVFGGVLMEECAQKLTRFFQLRRT